jgi:DNA-binding response OmpR family regulator
MAPDVRTLESENVMHIHQYERWWGYEDMVTTNRQKRVLLLDDERSIVEALAAYLQREGFDVAETHCVEEALAAYKQSDPDIMVLDITLPDGSGLDVLRAAHADGRSTPAIMLTARGEEIDRILGLELGADDYITKPFSPREVVARVRAVLRRSQRDGETSQKPKIVIVIDDLEMDFGAHEVRVAGEAIDLTAKEFRILRVFMEHPGQTFTRASLLDSLDDGGETFERTLDRHINNIRKKIEPGSENPQYLQTVHGVGYKMRARDR